ncbi:hypothetical protein F4553_002106 [Allocatelliglobosispora scoriae]|uniref:Uncharacterized protein n=1 Tax=Allocatelliglobosispora scoriae TaxID=643052 RepID=A0A841BHZ1_9ACTN|nr:hypothetical protein [Allocatelliglobosispora scoriae]MBB5868727.1 hypothetical protein [Allocatelliglobosispora scoriae]
MSEIQLSPNARQSLIGLLLLEGEATNPVLKTRFSLEIGKPAREALIKAGFITAQKGTEKGTKQTMYHTLTKSGWERGRTEMTTPPPTSSGAVAWALLLYGVLGRMDRLMTEKNLTVEQVFSASDIGDEVPAIDDRAPEDRVLDAYSKLAKRPGDLVSLVHLRDSLADISKADLDRVLKAMDRQRTIQLEPDPNRKALPPEAHEAAISIGGEDKHLITIGRA